ncbi:MAG: DUF2256 domain-containing protein [Nanoarchaeota archaeon]|nr:DUF2256 domain-containing protein [Nanoarchaeota archaeon]
MNNEIYYVIDRGVKKKAKDCIVCSKMITWRKKWKNNFEEVKYCSEKCKLNSKQKF